MENKEQQYFYSDAGDYKVKFWQPAREFNKYKDELMEAITGCCERGELVLGFGEQITSFEKNFAEFIGVKHAVMCGSGTQALCLAYASLGIGPGDEVITTSHTFIATIDQIARLGAKPVLVDIGPDGLIDPKLVEEAITEKTKAIVPVHLEGKVCDMDAILDIAKRHNLLVIEDAAQAIGASWEGKRAGSMGNAGCYSFYPAKVLGCLGNGGAMVTNSDEVAAKARMLRCNSNIGKNSDMEAVFGWNLEPDAIQAAVLNVKLKYLPERLEARRKLAERYDEAFSDLDILLPVKQAGRVYQDYVVRMKYPYERKAFLAHLDSKGIKYLGASLIPNHKYPKLGLECRVPKTEEYLETQVRLPLNPDLLEEEVAAVIEAVKSFYA